MKASCEHSGFCLFSIIDELLNCDISCVWNETGVPSLKKYISKPNLLSLGMFMVSCLYGFFINYCVFFSVIAQNTKSMGLRKSLSGFGNIKKEVKPNDPHKRICDN